MPIIIGLLVFGLFVFLVRKSFFFWFFFWSAIFRRTEKKTKKKSKQLLVFFSVLFSDLSGLATCRQPRIGPLLSFLIVIIIRRIPRCLVFFSISVYSFSYPSRESGLRLVCFGTDWRTNQRAPIHFQAGGKHSSPKKCFEEYPFHL